MKLKTIIQSGVVALGAATLGVSCTDTWDEHYSVSSLVPQTALWESLQSDEELKPFVRVLEACDYDDVLTSGQAFTVWAPVISDEKADELIEQYKAEKAKGVRNRDNSVLNEFVKQHIAQFNQNVSQVTEERSVLMMNGKKLALTNTTFAGTHEMSEAINLSNGVIYKIGEQVEFMPNVYEYIKSDSVGDEGLDSIANFFKTFDVEYLDESSSVPGEIINGQVHYLDSVIYYYNALLGGNFGYIDSEDSAYYAIVPTNKVWNEQLDKYKKYFEYSKFAKECFSTINEKRYNHDYLLPRLAMTQAGFFNVRWQPNRHFDRNNIEAVDTLYSTTYRSNMPDYLKFANPFKEGGIFEGLTGVECSNGRVYKTGDWKFIPEDHLLFADIQQEAESSNRASTIPVDASSKADSTNFTRALYDVQSGSKFKCSNDRFTYVIDNRARPNRRFPELNIKVAAILSNVPYDIYVVFATPLAADSLNTEWASQKVRVNTSIYRNVNTNREEFQTYALKQGIEVNTQVMDTVCIAEGYTFPVCTYGETDGEDRTRIVIQNAYNRNIPDGYTYNFAVDCVILKPHVTEVAEEEE